MKIKLPFWLFPGSWGLRGKTRKIAEIEYLYDGEERERKLAELEYGDDKEKLEKENLKIDLKYGKISEIEYKKKLLQLEKLSEKELELKKLDLLYEYKKISKKEYEKAKATFLEQPWVDISFESDPENLIKNNTITFTIDYNKYFIKMLKENYGSSLSVSDDELIDEWFKSLAYGILLEDENFLELEINRNKQK